MMHLKTAASLAVIAMVSACAAPAPVVQQSEIRPQPTFDKFGGGSCEEGYVYIPGTAPQPPECIPIDECDEVTLADGSVEIECPEPGRDPDPSDSSTRDESPSDPVGRDPTGAPRG